MNNSKISVAIADDHTLFIEAIKSLINTFPDCQVLYSTCNGKEMIAKLKSGLLPDVLILDMRMPVLDGIDTAIWIRQYYPEINIIMLTMHDTDATLLRLLKAGVKAILKKNTNAQDLHEAIKHVTYYGQYYGKDSSGRFARLFVNGYGEDAALKQIHFTEEEINLLKLVSTELTYKEIAKQMHTNPRMIDTLREALFNKLNIKSRVGLAIFAMRHGLVG